MRGLRPLALLAVVLATRVHAADAPSFDCSRATSPVTRMICASPELSALDRQLAEHYRMLLSQSGPDAPALQKEEAQWLREVRNPCRDAACVTQAYALWDAVLVARSRRLASLAGGTGAVAPAPPAAAPSPSPSPSPGSVFVPVPTPAPAPRPSATPTPTPAPPAASPIPRPANTAPAGPVAAAETRPFAVEEGLLADARSLRGRACAPGEDVPREPGYVPVPGSLPIIGRGHVVLARERLDADFAFLLDTRRGACRMVDVVVLPPHVQVGHLLQCVLPSSDGSATPLSSGIGLRRDGQDAPFAYWEIDLARGQFIREPLGVLGWASRLQCRQPEIGDGLAPAE